MKISSCDVTSCKSVGNSSASAEKGWIREVGSLARPDFSFCRKGIFVLRIAKNRPGTRLVGECTWRVQTAWPSLALFRNTLVGSGWATALLLCTNGLRKQSSRPAWHHRLCRFSVGKPFSQSGLAIASALLTGFHPQSCTLALNFPFVHSHKGKS